MLISPYEEAEEAKGRKNLPLKKKYERRKID